MSEIDRESEAYIERLFRETGIELGPKPDRVSEAYADERIQEKIARFEDPRARAGLWSIDRALKERDVPPNLRLHLIAAVANLGEIGRESLPARVGRIGEASGAPFVRDPDQGRGR